MISLTAAQLGAVRRAAAAHHVAQLELFGSAARGEAEPHDVDFIVRFQPLPPLEQGRTYLRLVSALAEAVERPVDLLVESSITNRYFLDAIRPERLVLYAP